MIDRTLKKAPFNNKKYFQMIFLRKKILSCELCIKHIFDFITSIKKLMNFMILFSLLLTMT